MPNTNFPGGASSFGIPLFGQGSVYDMPWGNQWFVSNATGVKNGDGTSRGGPMVSIADALARAGAYDVINVGAGHAENVTASNVFSASLGNTGAQVIPAGVRIIGFGQGNQRPALTFTAAASAIALAAAGSSIENMQFICPQTGTTTVAALVVITAAYCGVIGNDMQMSSSATALCTTGISTTSACAGARIIGNTAWGLTGTPTSWYAPTGTVGCNRVTVAGNTVQLPLSATTGGCVDLSANSGTAPLDWIISGNLFRNSTASSTVAMKGCTGCTGMVVENYLGIANATGGAASINTPGNWNMDECYGGVPAKVGILAQTTSG